MLSVTRVILSYLIIWPKGHDIGRWAHANVKLHFFSPLMNIP